MPAVGQVAENQEMVYMPKVKKEELLNFQFSPSYSFHVKEKPILWSL